MTDKLPDEQSPVSGAAAGSAAFRSGTRVLLNSADPKCRPTELFWNHGELMCCIFHGPRTTRHTVIRFAPADWPALRVLG